MTKILVIEDEAPLLQEMIETLTFEGFEAFGATDGLEGVARARSLLPDLILCDISMPHLDGYGVLLELQGNLATQAIPFIYTSARADKEDIRKGMLLGADDYLTKPFTRFDLLQAIRSRLARKAELENEWARQTEAFEHAIAMEHEERMLQTKLVAMFSHDFGNQLAVILAGASILRDYADKLTPERRLDRLNAIIRSTHILISMRDDMMLMAQMDTGSFPIKPAPIDVGQFIQEIIEEFETSSDGAHRLRFRTNVNEPIMSDSRLLRQILANLISNAIKYSAADSDVEINLEDYGKGLVLSVQDHGIGISEADLSRMFKAFQRGTNVGKIAGTGLGLAVVKQAVDLIGGSVSIESQVGSGTTVHVELPYLAGTTA